MIQTVSIRDFFVQLLTDRSLRGWRDVRATWRELLIVLVIVALVGYVLALLVWSGIGNHCLWDHSGSRCENGGGR
jgi:hypothetical protein